MTAYKYRPGDDEREAAVQARLATLRARLENPPRDVPELRRPSAARCEDCGYRIDAPGHLSQCAEVA
jgi:hypothetical protein